MKTLAIINTITNICENITLDDRSIDQIVLPEPYIIVDLYQTPAIGWTWNNETTQWDEVDTTGGIGCTWDGTKLIHPKPLTPS